MGGFLFTKLEIYVKIFFLTIQKAASGEITITYTLRRAKDLKVFGTKEKAHFVFAVAAVVSVAC